MTVSAAWHARVELGEQILGAGILVDREHILTCAHLVGDHLDFQVTFLKAPTRFRRCKAQVCFRGPWRQRDDPGDVAVLRLAEPVDIPPAKFAGPGEPPPPHDRSLLVYGYPRGMPGGSYAQVTADFDQELSEGIQVGAEAAHLERLQKGFSGGAVYDRVSGTVIGMITDAVRDPAIGRMLPVDLLRRHWEQLDEVLPLEWLGTDDVRALRAIVAGVEPDVPVEELFATLFPGVWRERDLVSTWDAIRYVAEECIEGTALARFLISLAEHLPAQNSTVLGDWACGRLLAATGENAENRTASIIVKIDNVREKDIYQVTMFSLVDGAVGKSDPPAKVRGGEVRAHVEREIDSLIGTVGDRVPVIEFALPESWLCEPVEEWSLYPGEDEPIGAYHPVVVRDVRRMCRGSRQTIALNRWKSAEESDSWAPEPIHCRYPEDKRRLRDLLAENRQLGALAYASPPRLDRLRVALNHGIPVMFWPREGCPDQKHASCPGDRFLDELTVKVKGIRPPRLPEHVMTLRAQAGSQPEPYGRGLTMFWDDPRRVPPPLFMEI